MSSKTYKDMLEEMIQQKARKSKRHNLFERVCNSVNEMLVDFSKYSLVPANVNHLMNIVIARLKQDLDNESLIVKVLVGKHQSSYMNEHTTVLNQESMNLSTDGRFRLKVMLTSTELFVFCFFDDKVMR